MLVLTLGYEGISIEEYVASLQAHSVGIVIDVRETAWSFKRGFSKRPLSAALKSAGIEYLHVKSAGNPSKNRRTARSTRECLQRYRRYLGKNPSCLDELIAQIARAHRRGSPACLTCYERLPADCHRSVLLDALRERGLDLSVTHIWLAADDGLELGLEVAPSI